MWDVITTGPITIMMANTQAAAQGAGADQMIPKPKCQLTSEERTRANLDNEKDNKLTVAMKKFEDFKMLPNEAVTDMELRFARLMSDLSDLRKELSEKEKNLKILRGLPKSWEMKVTAMRDHRDMKTTNTTKIFSDLKAYEFEHEPKDADEPETRNENEEVYEEEQLPRFSSLGTPKLGHFKANCPHPIVSKHQDNNTTKSPSKEAGENYKRNDKPESSNSINERRRKAMVVNETSDNIEAESSSSSSSSDDDSSEEEKGLLCLFSQESDELCLIADDDEVNSQSFSCYSAESSSMRSQTSNESVTEMMREFKIIKNTYSKLKEENSRLMISYNALRQVRIENIKLAIAKK
ncbi:PREDICTED: uncharacterized protein LOC109177128 [Ipomoea nil]|uniref:uncharacterized protein LOC109177128 n=1 Tax=Ipomoea nil TaxID=35883 RepID=UPI000900ABC3|nr:PREDICTED: uncharacterized protein LOC109177128 [Ipomoea nil]